MPLGTATRSLLASIRGAVEVAGAAGGASSSTAIHGAQALAALFNVDGQQHALLQPELARVTSADDIVADVARALPTSLPGPSTSGSTGGGPGTGAADLSRFATFVAEWLVYLARHPPVGSLIAALSAHSAGALPWDVGAAYEAWSQVYSRAHLVFGLAESYWFIPTLRWLSETLVVLGIKTDTYLHDPKQRNATDAASRLSKSAGLAGNDRAPAPSPSGIGTKRPAAMFLANQSFRAYFKLNNVRLCETVLSSVENAIKINRQAAAAAAVVDGLGGSGSGAGGGFGGGFGKGRRALGTLADPVPLQDADPDELAQSGYTRADRVTYRYYLGRMRLHQHRLRAAETELTWAFQNCLDGPTQSSTHKNKRLILLYLLTASIPLGKLPTGALLRTYDLDGVFGHLVHSFRRGAAWEAMGALEGWREWHRRRGTYLILREKLQIGLWRNLVRRAMILSRPYYPPTDKAPPNIKLALLAATARLAWRDDQIETDDVECILVSLIDQGYIKGYIHPDKALLITQRNAQLGFVPMRQVYQ